MKPGEIKPESVAHAFGKALRQRRKEIGLSQEKLAEICELDRTYISMLERGIHQPSLTIFLRLAHALEISPSSLLEGLLKDVS